MLKGSWFDTLLLEEYIKILHDLFLKYSRSVRYTVPKEQAELFRLTSFLSNKTEDIVAKAFRGN